MSDTRTGAGLTGRNEDDVSEISGEIGGAISDMQNAGAGANKWFGAIGFSPGARAIARQGALAAWICAVMIIAGMGIAYADFMNSASDGAISRQILNEKIIASAVALLFVLFFSWRIWSGKGFVSAAALAGFVGFAFVMSALSVFAGGIGAIMSTVVHGVVLVLSINGMRGAWAYWVYFIRAGAPGDAMRTVPE